jgi:hypothetical protein
MLQAGRSRIPIPTRSLDFLNLPNPSSRPIVMDFTQQLKEISVRKEIKRSRPLR